MVTSMKRRTFLSLSGAAAVTPVLAENPAKVRRVAVIGHTGRGDYGHGLDTVWLKIPNAAIVGVADPDATGLEKAVRRLKTNRGFREYRRMLKEVTPEFVSVCPRHADQHAEMVIACIEAGVKGIYVEKPFCRTPSEVDRMRAACEKHGARIAVAHRNRYHPVLPAIQDTMEGIGNLLEIRGRGKGDRRGGAEDLWVLGSHVLNMIHFFGGAPVSCSALMLKDGEHVSWGDVLDPGPEGLGAIAGDELHARFELSSGIVASFDSIQEDGTENAGFGLQLIGNKGIIVIHADRDPLAHFVKGNPFAAPKEPRPWIPITSGGVGRPEEKPELVKEVQEHVVAIKDLIEAVDKKRDPLCGLEEGAIMVEMICAVFESHRQGGKAVSFPLQERGNPLAQWRVEQNQKLEEANAVKVAPKDFPLGVPVPGMPGFCFNPFTKNKVDLRGIPPGTLVRDPDDPDPTHKFRAP